MALSLASAVLLYLFIGGLRDAAATILLGLARGQFVGWEGRQWVNPHELSVMERYTQNLFASGLAVTLAQRVAIRIWLTHRGWREPIGLRRHRYRSVTWAGMWCWMLALISFKAAETYWLYIVVHEWLGGGIRELDLLRDVGWLLFLLLAVGFVEQWSGLRRTYRGGGWMLGAAVLSLVLALGLAFLSPLSV
ncbi:MAG: hypothetical protein AAF791_12640 [Bacteroidota bacterium]